eukprot:363186-Chlamydomonas_euryale.AAC.3
MPHRDCNSWCRTVVATAGAAPVTTSQSDPCSFDGLPHSDDQLLPVGVAPIGVRVGVGVGDGVGVGVHVDVGDDVCRAPPAQAGRSGGGGCGGHHGAGGGGAEAGGAGGRSGSGVGVGVVVVVIVVVMALVGPPVSKIGGCGSFGAE